MTTPSTPAPLRPAVLFVAVLAVAALLRAPVTSVPPVLGDIRASLHLSEAAAGATTSLPLLCFGAFAFLATGLVTRLGLERTVAVLLVPIVLGILVRSIGSTPMFFVGATLLGCGIAVGNVVVPALIRSRVSHRLALAMALYSMTLQLSGAAGSAFSVPLDHATSAGWRGGLLFWALPAAVVLACWLVIARRSPRHDRAAVAAPTGLARVAAKPSTWGITAFMGLQSALFYTLLTWLPTQLGEQGISPATAGLLLGLFSFLGLPGSFLAPRLLLAGYAAPTLVAVFAVEAVSVLMLQGGEVWAVVATVALGLAQGAALAIALTFIASPADAHDVPAVSAISQGVGYLVAAAGPILVGALAGATGSWRASNLVCAAIAVALAAIGLGVARSLFTPARRR